VIRLKVPEHQDIVIEDMVRGNVQFNTADLDDKVLIKSDGMPTYHMANVVDDRLMEISHVIRGEEWLSSTAHHVLLYRAFGWEDRMPRFAHLPLILKPVGNGKLSKRDGAQFGFPVFPISWKTPDDESLMGFREYGFEPHALLNFLALLGWNDGTEQELFSIDEMVQAFSLEKIVKSGARFDFEKGKWFNQQYLHQLPEAECIGRIKRDFERHGVSLQDAEAREIFQLYHDRVLFSKDYYDLGKVYFNGVERYDADYLSKKFKPEFIPVLKEVVLMVEALNDWNATDIESGLKSLIQGGRIKPGELFPLLRVVMSGLPTGPDVFKMVAFTGKHRLEQRMDSFLHHLNV
jgi:glutamyl-tRNA synthetase